MLPLLQRSRLFIVLALTAASGALAGSIGNRWARPADLVAAGEKIDQTPKEFGDWELRSAAPFDELAAEVLQCAGSTKRTYQNRQTGAVVQMALFVGPTGPTSVHTPDVCYTGANYVAESDAKEFQVRPQHGSSGTFWEIAFRSQNLEGGSLRVLFGWNAGGRWVAPKRPRIEFAGSPLLYKLMVVSSVEPGQTSANAGEVCHAFLAQLLPALDPVLLKTSD